jgi:ABC-type protease/lipase transport system fused ATPase/permease subunit
MAAAGPDPSVSRPAAGHRWLRHAPRSPLSTALADCRHALIGVGLFSAVLNMLQLTGPIFMLEVYDRVIPSRSIPTLVGISILARSCSASRVSSTLSAAAFWCESRGRSTRR